ncbi:MAG: addiction module protein, partial [Armatimonadetes bacterium]|nr:addiction module protein [Armatimonadota bacterium]
WDSLPPHEIPISEGHRALLDQRLAEFEEDGDPGEPWETVLDEIEKKGY